jgi:hypothetical protein
MARPPRPGNPAPSGPARGPAGFAGWAIALRPALVGLAVRTSLVGTEGFPAPRRASRLACQSGPTTCLAVRSDGAIPVDCRP